MPHDAPCPDLDSLKRFALGRVARHEAHALDGHLLDCARCGAILDGLRVADPLVDALRSQPPDGPGPEDPFLEELIVRLQRLCVRHGGAVPPGPGGADPRREGHEG